MTSATGSITSKPSPTREPARADGPIVLYDGVCALCNGFVKFILRFDRRRTLRFAALDGDTGTAARAGDPGLRTVDSIVLLRSAGALTRSAAAIEILREMGGVWRAAVAGYLIPRPIRDALYDRVARSRYDRFGRYDACPLPPAEDRWRFLA
jgi:predicted DCC family thiol-disulfide oxidoreductase YuxK